MGFIKFVKLSFGLVLKGHRTYFMWLALLLALIALGAFHYLQQLQQGLIVTSMRDQISWGFYIGNFTFMVGVAAAAVVLVVPAYIYDWKPIKEIVLLGELLAVSAIIVCVFLVTVDIGRPERAWHLTPIIGNLNWPASLLAWDIFALTGYFILNWFIVTYLVYKAFAKQEVNHRLLKPLIYLSIPLAVSIHTVTAFLYVAVPGRPFWHNPILAPRFLASAFCSGPALLLIVFQIIRARTSFDITDKALDKIAELLTYAMVINLFLFGCELFTEFYSPTEHTIHAEYMFFGLHGHQDISIYIRIGVILNLIACTIYLFPPLRHNRLFMNLGALMVFCGVYIEKGMGLIIPGLTPDPLGDLYHYFPSPVEWFVGIGVLAFGALIYTLMVKVAIPISLGQVDIETELR
ncbi:polysulfide reductase NrfD [Oligoflexia bacterium]|nr:polysulfide reductase NrfD [Oligoflexia bacterium]